MGQLVLLVVAAAWAAVLIPPLLRSRIENRPNSSVTDFRNQLSSLQKAMPSRSVTMRSMARPLAPSPLSRPAATGRPALRSGVRTHNGTSTRTNGHAAPRHDSTRMTDVSPRSHGGRVRPADRPRIRSVASRPVAPRDGVKRRRANVLFVLVLIAFSSLFLAATTKTETLFYVFGATFTALCGYVYVLGQRRQRDLAAEEPEPVSFRQAPRPQLRRQADLDGDDQRRAVSRTTTPMIRATSRSRQVTRATMRRQPERWSHAV